MRRPLTLLTLLALLTPPTHSACPASSTTLGWFCVGSTQTVCPAGSYCPAGTAVAIPCPCGTWGQNTGLSAPACSGTVGLGYYTLAGATSSPGTPCPAGVSGNATGLCTAGCAGPCPAGFYCGGGQTGPCPARAPAFTARPAPPPRAA